MKITKKMKKKTQGMNHATQKAVQTGERNPVYQMQPPFKKIVKGVPYVNVSNFV